MRLNRAELEQLVWFLRGKGETPNPEILEKMELGIFVFSPLPFGNLNIFGPDFAETPADWPPLFLTGRFGAQRSMQLLQLFRERHIPYLLVRTESYEALINCNGEVMSAHSEDDQDSIRETIEKLRQRCSEKHPSVNDNR